MPGTSLDARDSSPKKRDLATPSFALRSKPVFVNRFGHFRAGWRIAIYFGITALITAAALGVRRLFPDQNGAETGPDWESPAFAIGYAVLVLLAVLAAWVTLRWADRRPFGALGLSPTPGWAREFLLGVGFGGGSVALVFLISWGLGFITVTAAGFSWTLAGYLLRGLAVIAVAATMEELVMRGYPFQAVVEGTGTWIAVLLFSLTFGLLHMQNKNWTWIGVLNIAFLGVLFSAAYLKTRSLWMPIGLHIAWNWIQGFLLGMNVSGVEIRRSVLVSQPKGPDFLSGGAFGAEGSLLASAVLVGLSFYVFRAEWLRPSAANAAIWRRFPAGYGIPPAEPGP